MLRTRTDSSFTTVFLRHYSQTKVSAAYSSTTAVNSNTMMDFVYIECKNIPQM
jgi:hypothetical protein